MIRDDNFKKYLDNGNRVKIICGAGNKDLVGITNLCALYSAAGVCLFDVNASKEAVKAAKKGFEYSGKDKDCFLCVSVGTKNDPHFTKYKINSRCTNCGKCANLCAQSAVSKSGAMLIINADKCIGCGICASECEYNAIDSYSVATEFERVIPPLIELGINCLEYHIISDSFQNIMTGFEQITKLWDGPISICLDRSEFGNIKIKNILTEMKNNCNNLFIVQADGSPMTGGNEDYKSTLQAVAMAEIIEKYNITPYIFMSGGTNSKTKELADLCKINYTGLAFGSYARKIVKQYIDDENLLKNPKLFEEALKKAQTFIDML